MYVCTSLYLFEEIYSNKNLFLGGLTRLSAMTHPNSQKGRPGPVRPGQPKQYPHALARAISKLLYSLQ